MSTIIKEISEGGVSLIHTAYLPNGFRYSDLSIELPTSVIDYLDDAGFV